MLGKPFIAEQHGSMGLVDSEKLCDVLVARECSLNKVRIADLANFKPPPPPTENHAMDKGSSTSTIEHG